MQGDLSITIVDRGCFETKKCKMLAPYRIVQGNSLLYTNQTMLLPR